MTNGTTCIIPAVFYDKWPCNAYNYAGIFNAGLYV